jgi:hypothetical protein
VKKAKRKERREAARQAASERRGGVVSARKTPTNPPAPAKLVDLQTGAEKLSHAAQVAASPYVWSRGADGDLRASDALVHRGTGAVVAMLDEFPQLHRLRLVRERQAERQYGIPAAIPVAQ